MDGRNIEPRTVLWAVAEISWEDHTGTPYRAPATLEDISVSGACIRLKTPITVGSKLTVKWQREQFFAVAKNCRSDGREFLLGVRRDTGHPSPPSKIASEIGGIQAHCEVATGTVLRGCQKLPQRWKRISPGSSTRYGASQPALKNCFRTGI